MSGWYSISPAVWWFHLITFICVCFMRKRLGLRRSTRRMKTESVTRICLIPSECGQTGKERLQPRVYCLARDELVRLSVEAKMKSGDLKITFLLPWPDMASWVPGSAWGSWCLRQGGEVERFCRRRSAWSAREWGWRVVFFRAGHEAWGLDFKECRESPATSYCCCLLFFLQFLVFLFFPLGFIYLFTLEQGLGS